MAPRIPSIPSSTDLSGQSALVTGSNTGIGFENARQFLQLKASPVYLAVRSVERGQEAKKLLLDDPEVKKKNPGAVVEIYQVDMASFDSVAAFAQKFSEVKKLNIAVLNAGVSFFKYIPTSDGYETVLQVNYLSNALLATHLLPLLKAGAAASGKPSHLAFVSSNMQHMTSLKKNTIKPNENIIDWFNNRANFGMDRYNVSKLLLTGFTNELASKIDSSQVVINSMCPGLVATNFDTNSPWYLKYLMKGVRSLMARTPSEGARALTLAAITGTEGNGKYYSDGKETPSAALLLTEDGKAFQKKLWDQTLERIQQLDPTSPPPI
ncbi:hypothetical protein TWF173_008040 [Orbilia oligospora]|uniref:Short chain dehydrogenase AOL_s00215g274 n=2 Tax=Orbilia oligospora TaxID=2813651 RepID=AR274_ARTOA|nr:hypothetical protein AOL_s00215g274 [Orbilia oligospora ATCC 24927]G1XTZ5.1 RecName: Full=Short chain dehydrogenase AOL_s00215g274; AltName: Full=Sesquiterpenyl epoxy-cyclohexenoids cluster protein AOL_s00215g274; Short=SECs cluster protein AOL_s00215g274 [Orbilia oligospora ATCC 24927]KAF3280227.1 hypothetical protein TWF970_002977 [Orbilia oligospora]EGX43538.1 hypothetical protein AOL_s00215g274 [Orbilia oligospora ATCC 24927]KAF3280228.1 hypothetical protein TWF970_002977 [Orbilia oligos